MRSESTRHFAALVPAAHALCFWPVWRWYVARMTDGSDEPWGIAALAAVILLTWRSPRTWTVKTDDRLLWSATLLTLAYVAAVPTSPPLVRAALAMAALACSWISVTGVRSKLAPVAVLFALSLPVIASLQFYLGYPLRSITTAGAELTLNVLGLAVERSSTALLWQGQTVLVDAPCSGVRMLWTGAALACALALHRDAIGWRGLAALLAVAAAAALLANVLRAAALFVVETRDSPLPGFIHPTIGAATFALTAASIVLVESLLIHRRRAAFRHA